MDQAQDPVDDGLEYESDDSYRTPPVTPSVTTLIPIEDEEVLLSGICLFYHG